MTFNPQTFIRHSFLQTVEKNLPPRIGDSAEIVRCNAPRRRLTDYFRETVLNCRRKCVKMIYRVGSELLNLSAQKNCFALEDDKN